MTTVETSSGNDSPPAYPSVAEFESGELDPQAFVHAAHVYVTWQLLLQCSVIETIQRFTSALRRLTKALDQEAKYHETITWFFILLIAERQAETNAKTWDAFAASNQDLVGSSGAILRRFYSDKRLWSERARKQFLLPDRDGNICNTA